MRLRRNKNHQVRKPMCNTSWYVKVIASTLGIHEVIGFT